MAPLGELRKVRIGLIICIFLIGVLVISNFWFFTKIEKQGKTIKQLQTQLNLSETKIKQLQTQLESRSPVQEYDYVIFKEEGVVKAKNGTTGNIEFNSSEASSVIREVLDRGNSIYIKSGRYNVTSDILLNNRSYVRFKGNWAKIHLNGHQMVIRGDNYTYSMYNRVSGLEIINGTLRIENSFKTTVRDMVFKNCTTAMEIANTRTWSEGTKIENCHFINCLEGIVFRTPIFSATKSYSNTEINRCYFTLYRKKSVAVKVETGADFTDSLVHNVRVWVGNFSQRGQTGILVEGSMLQTLLQNVVFESFAETPTHLYGIKLGKNVEPPLLGGGISFLGNWTWKIYNPFHKWVFGVGGAFKREGIKVPIGLNGEYGRIKTVDAYILEITSFKARIQIEGTFNYNETITVRFRLEYIDNTVSGSVKKTFNQTGGVWLDSSDLLKLTPHHNMIESILVDAKTDSPGTDTTVRIDVYGTTA